MTEEKAPDMIINFVLDTSGSMHSRRTQTISAYNEYLAGVKADAKEKNQKVLFSLTQFNTTTDPVHVAEPIEDIPDLNEESYAPGGGTALLDAVGTTVNAVDSKIDEHKWRPAVLCVVLTDGEENSSNKFTNEIVKKLIKDKEAQGNWTFVFLGADMDAWEQGATMGFSSANTASYDAGNMAGTMRAVAKSTSHYSSNVSHGIAASPDFFGGLNSDDGIVRGIDIGSEQVDSDEEKPTT